jgi:hypothetical protein
MIELTEEQQRELDGPGPVRLRDPRTNATYVLVREEEYATTQGSRDETFPQDAYPAVDAAFRADWDRPEMAKYDQYEEHKP